MFVTTNLQETRSIYGAVNTTAHADVVFVENFEEKFDSEGATLHF